MKKLVAILLVLVIAVAMFAGCQEKEASYPERPINLIVPFGAGGGTDGWNRAIAAALVENGWDVKVSNVTGGSAGSVGTAQVWNGKHDGYTLAGTSETPLCIPVMAGDEQTTESWEYYIAGGSPGILCVNAEAGIADLQALVDACDAGSVNIAGTSGGLWFLLASMVSYATDIDLQVATYDGSAGAIAACVSGETEAVAASAGEVAEYVKDGTLVPIAVYDTESFTHADFGTVPAITSKIPELGAYLPLSQFIGFMVPKDTPDDIKAEIEKTFLDACESASLKQFAENNYAVLYKLVGAEADALTRHQQSVMSWMLYDMGKTEHSPEEVGIPKP